MWNELPFWEDSTFGTEIGRKDNSPPLNVIDISRDSWHDIIHFLAFADKIHFSATCKEMYQMVTTDWGYKRERAMLKKWSRFQRPIHSCIFFYANQVRGLNILEDWAIERNYAYSCRHIAQWAAQRNDLHILNRVFRINYSIQRIVLKMCARHSTVATLDYYLTLWLFAGGDPKFLESMLITACKGTNEDTFLYIFEKIEDHYRTQEKMRVEIEIFFPLAVNRKCFYWMARFQKYDHLAIWVERLYPLDQELKEYFYMGIARSGDITFLPELLKYMEDKPLAYSVLIEAAQSGSEEFYCALHAYFSYMSSSFLCKIVRTCAKVGNIKGLEYFSSFERCSNPWKQIICFTVLSEEGLVRLENISQSEIGFLKLDLESSNKEIVVRLAREYFSTNPKFCRSSWFELIRDLCSLSNSQKTNALFEIVEPLLLLQEGTTLHTRLMDLAIMYGKCNLFEKLIRATSKQGVK